MEGVALENEGASNVATYVLLCCICFIIANAYALIMQFSLGKKDTQQ